MRRRIFLWMGLLVLFTMLCPGRDGLAKDIYKVQKGDTLTAIARNAGTTVDALMKANRLKGSQLKIHQVLVIPASQDRGKNRTAMTPLPTTAFYTVHKGDHLGLIARKTGVPLANLKQLNQLKSDKLRIGQRLVLREPREDNVGEKDPALHRLTQPPLVGVLDEEEEGGLHREPLDSCDCPERGNPLLGYWSHPGEPQRLVKVAMGFLGAPYRLGGSSVTGIDCSAFVRKVYQIFDITLPRTALEQSRVGMRISRDELTVGDLLFFKTRQPVGHVGIYVGDNKFVHASSRKRGVRVDNLSTPYYHKRFVRAVRLKEWDGHP